MGNTAVLVYMARQKATEHEPFDVDIMRTAAEAGDFEASGMLCVRHFDRREYKECIDWGERTILKRQSTTDMEQVARIHAVVSSAFTLMQMYRPAAEHARSAASLAPDAVPTIPEDSILELEALAREQEQMYNGARGAAQSRHCTSCGAGQPSQSRFCPFCGASASGFA